ncbi:LysE family translocator [Actinacidiphila acidipaludis]|uniref:LysE family translocator n=1 Tax=Actinacidiphila acidipaludis TaxID=2873382 RepID=UPI003556F1FE
MLAVLPMVPGPDMAVVTRRAVSSGWQDGLRTVGGITVGLLVWGVLTIVGLAAVLAASAAAYTVVKLAGAAYLFFLGVHALLNSRQARAQAPDAHPDVPAGNPWRTGLVNNVFNPKIAVFYTSLPGPRLLPEARCAPGHGPRHRHRPDRLRPQGGRRSAVTEGGRRRRRDQQASIF